MGSFTMKEGAFYMVDYVVFTILIIISCAGGVWYGVTSSKLSKIMDVKDYLLGGRELNTWPVALSLIASYISGVTLLGTPAEIYNYGSQYTVVVFGVALSCVAVVWFYLPVFLTLKLSSSYEYLELRFNRHVRACASILFLIDEILFLPMVIFIPSMAFNQLTGVNVYVVACAQVLVCGLYTALGGLKAVVWTDSVQTIIMFVGVIIVGVAGTIAVGGMGEVLRIVNQTGRFDFSNWSFSPYERQTGWAALIGGFVYWTCFNSVNQTMVQRYISLPNKKKVIQAVAIFCVGAVISILICVWLGLAAWATWVQGGCHPGGMPLVNDRLLPAFVTYVARVKKMTGLSGVFLAGVFGAGLSSLSAILNACALVVIEDLIRGWLNLKLKPMTEGILVRVFTGLLAVVSVLMLIVVQKLGGILGVATALSAIAASTTCGVFTLGMGCWWVGPKGAIAGAIAGALTSGGISMGCQAAAARGLRFPPLNMTTTCAVNATVGMTLAEPFDPETVFPLFRISYHWIAPLGWLATLFAGMIVGKLFDKKEDLSVDAELYAPCVWRCLPKEFIEKQGVTRRMRAAREAAHAAPLMMSPIDKPETSR